MKTPPLLIALCFALLAGTPAAALTPQGRHITGTIQKVDARAQEVEMLREDKGTLVKFIWNKQTMFVADMRIVDASILKKGARVEAICHTPFFGKPFVTKVTLLPITEGIGGKRTLNVARARLAASRRMPAVEK